MLVEVELLRWIVDFHYWTLVAKVHGTEVVVHVVHLVTWKLK